MWSILSALHYRDITKNHDRVTKYERYENSLKFDNIQFPVKLNKIPKFEKFNKINVNVFSYDEKYNVFPLQISKNNFNKVFDLLLISNKNNDHYCWIKNVDGLASKQINKDSHKYFHCKKCMHGFKTKDLLEKHNKNCTTEPNKIVLPDEKEKFMKFKNYAHQLKVPFVIYADFEFLTIPLNSNNNRNNNISFTEAYQHHTPCGFAYKVVCCENQYYSKPKVLYRGKSCVEKFLDCMMQEKKYINKIIQQNKTYRIITEKNKENYKTSKVCHICEKI